MTPTTARRHGCSRLIVATLLFLAWSLVLSKSIASRLEELLPSIKAHYGIGAAARIQKWETLLVSGSSLSEPEKLRLANEFFNAMPNVDDQIQWGQADYWATPLELLISNGGDCEDFAFAKYFTLRELGVPDERLRIAYVKAYLPRSGGIESHMVLTYYASTNAEPLVLDNLKNAILPASARPDLVPSYSFEGLNLWSARRRRQGDGIGALDGMETSSHLEGRAEKVKEAKEVP